MLRQNQRLETRTAIYWICDKNNAHIGGVDKQSCWDQSVSVLPLCPPSERYVRGIELTQARTPESLLTFANPDVHCVDVRNLVGNYWATVLSFAFVCTECRESTMVQNCES